ncbi:hypothetical protein Z043_112089 [Scleropages formosus]|uniref:Uncharacterized protein n=1 Tax=Scleropages formosus TaxID=113540 RepID=A0A0P7V7K7_SCLFO|nr:hypothetical protein Z043_112089 [Scleropages formosus]
MEDDAPVIYGLEFQARALTAQTAETDAIRFLVGTQSLKFDNQPNKKPVGLSNQTPYCSSYLVLTPAIGIKPRVRHGKGCHTPAPLLAHVLTAPTVLFPQIHIIDFDDENNIINKSVLLHQVGEIWHMSASPADKSVLTTCYNTTSDSRVATSAAVWRMPKEFESGTHESPDDSSNNPQALELLCHLDNAAQGNMAWRCWVSGLQIPIPLQGSVSDSIRKAGRDRVSILAGVDRLPLPVRQQEWRAALPQVPVRPLRQAELPLGADSRAALPAHKEVRLSPSQSRPPLRLLCSGETGMRSQCAVKAGGAVSPDARRQTPVPWRYVCVDSDIDCKLCPPRHSVLWEPMGDGKRLVSLADNHVALWDLEASSTKATVSSSATLEGKGQLKFTSGKWSPHHNCTQLATANDTAIRGWDLRSMRCGDVEVSGGTQPEDGLSPVLSRAGSAIHAIRRDVAKRDRQGRADHRRLSDQLARHGLLHPSASGSGHIPVRGGAIPGGHRSRVQGGARQVGFGIGCEHLGSGLRDST